VVYTSGDTECVETRCPNCRKAVYWIVRTVISDGQMSWEIRENDRECACDLDDKDRQWLELVAIQAGDDTTEDEEWWSLYRERYPDHDGAEVTAHVNRDISMDAETGAALDEIIAAAVRRLDRTE
jgi:hypothetical protein